MEDPALTEVEIAMLQNAGYAPRGGGMIDGRLRLRFIKNGETITSTRAEWRAVIAELTKPPTEDEIAFGADAWVYCRAHVRAHQTGWCGVSNRDKVGLGVTTAQEAYAKCREWGFPLYDAQSGVSVVIAAADASAESYDGLLKS